MKRRAAFRALAMVALAATILTTSAASWAQTPGTESAIPPGEIADVLRARTGKSVSLLLSSGKEYGGTVGEVRGESVVIRSVAGKEFYDALVRIDDITAVEIRRER